MDLCATCKQRVEDGTVVCPNCGAKLDMPGAFTQVVGWVITAFSTVPFAISEVTTANRNPVPLIIGVVLLVLGISLVISGRVRAKGAPPTTISDTNAAPPSQSV